jgi:predicted dehydrogenase
MAGTKRPGKVRVGIAGLDHWYIGLDAAAAAAAHPDVELVVVAHRDAARARETAERHAAAEWSTDYAAVAGRDDLDVVVTACRTDENAALCRLAAQHGASIISVKPIAMTRAEAATIQDAVARAGVHFISWESYYRLHSRYRQIKAWLDEGRIGRPISALYVMRVGLPTQVWRGVHGKTWWLDPAHAPGGGWIDHAIYQIDLLRWLFGAEVAAAYGVVANLVHIDLTPPLEDFGLSALTFTGGQTASLEVTWTAAPGASYVTTHLVGSEGAVILSSASGDQAAVSGHFEGAGGWTSAPLPPNDGNPIAGMVVVLREGGSLPAAVSDACRNLDVCLTFYEAARERRTKEITS